jgi:hypothetical protein
MKVGDHLLERGNPSGHVAEVIELAAIVYADVRVSVPDEDAVNTAVPFLQVIEIPLDRVLPSDGIVEVVVLNHHLRLHVAALRPLQFRPRVFRAVITDALQILHAPALHVGDPLREILGR